ncbi:Hypothetical_protein [Hexamita inflata]|uniref:Hypothetical_protein n=1 Tax=Hexamita inflata TaxID=28002 RepID=A0AA86UJT4_9EUKA|nr:Hypothetical protein HINF_LOCUS48795 [Hexamita inflata]
MKIRTDMKIIVLLVATVLFTQSLILSNSTFYYHHFFVQFVIVNQIILTIIATVVMLSCAETREFRIFTLFCIISYYLYANFLTNFVQLSKRDQQLLFYGERIILLVYAYRNVKNVLNLQKIGIQDQSS